MSDVHESIVACLDHERVAPRVSLFEVGLSFDGSPHPVTFWPDELAPFALRYHFQAVEDDCGDCHLWLVHREQFAPPVPEARFDGSLDWSPRHERTFSENAFRYRRFAEHLLESLLAAAGDLRRGALLFVDDETDGLAPDQLDDLYLIQLSMHVDDELAKHATDKNESPVSWAGAARSSGCVSKRPSAAAFASRPRAG